jgi:hypothetical protein
MFVNLHLYQDSFILLDFNLRFSLQTLVAPGRKFVKEGELTFYKSPKSKSGEKRTVFFFTDLILLTVKKGEQHFQFKMSVKIDACKLTVFADTQCK